MNLGGDFEFGGNGGDLGGDGGDLGTLRADAHQAKAAFDAYLERARRAARYYPDPSARFAEILQHQDCPATFKPSMHGAEDEAARQWLFSLLFEGTAPWKVDAYGSVSIEAKGGQETMSALLSTIEVGIKYVIIYNVIKDQPE